MEFFCVVGGPLGRLVSPHSSLRLLLLVTAQIILVSGQSQVGVSLRLHGAALPNDSIVDIDDVMYTQPVPRPFSDLPSNTNPRDEAVLCVTDLVDCCASPHAVRGNWYLPDGTRVGMDTQSFPAAFYANRGPNEVINGQRVYGSVRLYRRFTPAQNGRFRCELPSAADSSVNKILYVNILQFGFRFDVDHVTFSPSTGSTATTAGQRDYSLNCSATLFELDRIISRSDVPSPNFQWSFVGSTSLPSGVTAMPTVMSSSNSTSETYTSTLQFNSPLSQCHVGSYTCRLGPRRLENSVMVTMNGVQPVSVQITTSGAKVLGQNGYSLTCNVAVDTSLNSITYQWTKNNGTQTQVGTDRVLSFSPLRLSDAGRYTCQATVSPCTITIMDTQHVTLQIPAPTSIMLSSSIPNPIPPFGSDVTLTCAVELSPAVDVPVTVNTVLTTDEGFTRTGIAQPVMGSSTNYTATFVISSFDRSNSGLYACSATVSLTSNAHISDSSTVSHTIRVTTGVYLALRGLYITNNSNINIKSTGLSSDNPNGALQCITDKLSCCSWNPGRGEWYQPNVALVQGTTSTTAFYRTRGANGEVFLNRPSDVESPTGPFCCEVPDGTNTNQTLCVNIVPDPIVSVHSDSPNHVFYGHPPTLTCTMEMSSVMTSPLSTSMVIVWKGPDGTAVASPTRPEMESLTLYTSSSSPLTSVDSVDSGEYTCTVRFENFGAEISASTNITIVDGVFQLRLKSVGICQQWYSDTLSSDKRKLYSDFIKDALVTAIKHHCKCHYPITNLNKDVFICEDSPPNFLIYRSSLLGTHNFNGTQIVDFIQGWVSTGPLIEVGGNSIRVDSSCPTALSSLDDPVCGEKEEKCSCDYNPKYAMCAQHLDDNNIANCFDGCVVRNG